MTRSERLFWLAMEAPSSDPYYEVGDAERAAAIRLADYAAALEIALGATVRAPWDPPLAPLDPDPLDVMEEREREYERACRRNGEEM